MSERVERLPSKIVQYDDYNNVALCEDGSVWEYFHMSKLWAQIHPPHEPPTQSAELEEALSMLRRLANGFWPTTDDASNLFQDVLKFLNQHRG
jgi:hypothetical protein